MLGSWRRGLGDTQADVSVFSNAQTVTFASTNFNGANIAIGYEHSLSAGVDLELIAEQEVGREAQGPNVRAELVWAF